MTDDWTDRVNAIMLPGEVIEDDVKKKKELRPLVVSIDDTENWLEAPGAIQQEQYRLGITVDGIVGPRTLAARRSALFFTKSPKGVMNGSLGSRFFSADEDLVNCLFYVRGDTPVRFPDGGMELTPSTIYAVPFDARTDPQFVSLIRSGDIHLDVYVYPNGRKNVGDGEGGVQQYRSGRTKKKKGRPKKRAAGIQLDGRVLFLLNQSANTVRLPGASGFDLSPGDTGQVALSDVDFERDATYRKLIAMGVLVILKDMPLVAVDPTTYVLVDNPDTGETEQWETKNIPQWVDDDDGPVDF